MKMATPREKDATDYLQKHRIMELLENLNSLLFFYRPENPRAFLVEQLKQLKVSQQCGSSGPNLFSNDDLDTIFGILDPNNQNYITGAQYRQALSTLGIREVNEYPDGFNEDRISRETFKSEAIEGLHRSSTTYK
ncbi:EF-hand calcium-binding domain-containing protein 10 [Takifugu rubripes]|nr:EF-hand calcium-binding domain-containing protein 10 [Takifugu rubripes]XP_056907370.1 EF-hand calcium-binding domain-containing protein 10 [Takifugu flavidus]|eukprot:XP_003967288.2 PREDICTED: EF-hand calcium-binding domain-containing protein 10-like [Takifugu rubripes]